MKKGIPIKGIAVCIALLAAVLIYPVPGTAGVRLDIGVFLPPLVITAPPPVVVIPGTRVYYPPAVGVDIVPRVTRVGHVGAGKEQHAGAHREPRAGKDRHGEQRIPVPVEQLPSVAPPAGFGATTVRDQPAAVARRQRPHVHLVAPGFVRDVGHPAIPGGDRGGPLVESRGGQRPG